MRITANLAKLAQKTKNPTFYQSYTEIVGVEPKTSGKSMIISLGQNDLQAGEKNNSQNIEVGGIENIRDFFTTGETGYSQMFIEDYQKRVNNITGGLRSVRRKISNKWVVDVDGRKFLCTIDDSNPESFNVDYGSGYSTLVTAWQYGENVFRCTVNKNKVNVKILSDDYAGNYVFQYMGSVIDITIRNTKISELEQFMPVAVKKEKPKFLKSPISGRMVRIKVCIGEEILMGGELCSIEAMKMENMIRSDFDLTIKNIFVQPDDIVTVGDVLMEFE